MAAEPVDWPGLMRLGLGSLRLSSQEFWSMTPGELRLALEGAGILPVAAAGPMGRRRLAELMANFPDAGGQSAPGQGGAPGRRGPCTGVGGPA
jgi:uncharacterized phage protein (TIGR02216 family)